MSEEEKSGEAEKPVLSVFEERMLRIQMVRGFRNLWEHQLQTPNIYQYTDTLNQIPHLMVVEE